MKKYIILLICLFVAALNFNIFLKPLNLVTGGNQGIAIIIKHVLHVKPSLTILIINIIALIISYILLKKETTIALIISSFAYPLFVKITNKILFTSLLKTPILVAIIAGLTCGITGGIIYKLNFTQGGISIINNLLHKYTKLKISVSNFILNSTIMIIGCIYFGFVTLIYSIIVISISSIIINIIMKKNKLTKKLN